MFGANSFGSAYFGQIWSGELGGLVFGDVVTGVISDLYAGDVLQPDTGQVRGAGRPGIKQPVTGKIIRGKVGA